MSIIDQMQEDKIAQNPFQAAHIANGLKLYELKTIAEQVARYKLYRRWRDAGEPPKVAYQNAIDGKEPYQMLLEKDKLALLAEAYNAFEPVDDNAPIREDSDKTGTNE